MSTSFMAYVLAVALRVTRHTEPYVPLPRNLSLLNSPALVAPVSTGGGGADVDIVVVVVVVTLALATA
jgi:hypothetical protein